MKVTPLKIPEVKLIEPDVFEDERGFFYESFNQQKFNEAIGQEITFVQDNHSKSSQGVLRGLHYQTGEHAQDKLVSCVRGRILDVAVDLRQDSLTFGTYVMKELSDQNHFQLFIPKGCAHGFICLAEETVISYKCSNFYHKDSEVGIIWNDPDINIEWPMKEPILSEKDKLNKHFADLTQEELF